MKQINRKAQNGAAAAGVVMLILFFGGIIVLFMGIDTVDANHLGVMVRLGQIKGVQEPGMKWTGMFTSVYQYDLRTRKETIDLSGANSAVDKTGQAVYATININYRVKPTKDTVTNLYKNVGRDADIADRLNIIPIVREGFKQATVQYEALEILEKRQEVKEQAKEYIRNNFPADYFEIEDIIITNIDFSEGFKEAIEQKKIAEQNALKEENQLEVVKFQQQQEIEKYKAEAEKLRLQKSQVTALLNQQKWIEKWDGQLPVYMMGTGNDMSMLLQMPTPTAQDSRTNEAGE
jgi:regulator of protease activity HflC (stomatin/prohibitin superfamily)